MTFLLAAAGLLYFAEPTPAEGIHIEAVVQSIHGRDEVPVGLFGTHNVPLSEERCKDWGIESNRKIHFEPKPQPTVVRGVETYTDATGTEKQRGWPKEIKVFVDCFWDRYQPALPVSDPKAWKTKLTVLAKGYAEAAKHTGQTHYLEFWNEPYLNWATRPGVNFHQAFYKTEGIKPGDPMILKGTSEPVPGLEWVGPKWVALKASNRYIDYFRTSRIPESAKAGETVKLIGAPGSITIEEGTAVDILGPCILTQHWFGKDTGQEFYWAGPANVNWYIEMYEVFGKALKDTNSNTEQLQIAAGWGFNMFNENWESWRRLYLPLIDRCHPWIDAIHEHHYGGDTRMVAVSYEVAYAYMQGKYNRRITFWNTEAGGHLDPEQPGNIKPANEGDAPTKARAAMTYLLRDVSYLLAHCPDKAFARAAHHSHENGGDEWAFKLLKPFRGKLLTTTCHTTDVWAASAWNGSTVHLLIFNDSRTEIELPITLDFSTKAATSFRVNTQQTQQDEKGNLIPDFSIQKTPLELSKRNSISNHKVSVPAKSCILIAYTPDQAWKPSTTRLIHQFYSPEILIPVKENTTNLSIEIPADILNNKKSARLRLIERSGSNTLHIAINGHKIKPLASKGFIHTIPIPITILKENNSIELSLRKNGTTVLVDAIGLELLDE